MYTAIAGAYDKLMKDFDYDKYYAFVKGLIGGVTLELAVGSGEFTSRYIASVPRVIGVDVSEDMLNIAAEKLKRHRAKLILLNEDMTKYLPDYKVDTVLSVCDGLNYVEDLLPLCKNIFAMLNKGGKFIFDISSQYKLQCVVGDNIFYEDREDLTYIWTNCLGDAWVDMDIAFFERCGEVYTRRDEQHRQYWHEGNDIINMLEGIGFAVEVVDGESMGAVSEKSNRLLVVAKK